MEPEIKGYLTEFNVLRNEIQNAVWELNDEGANWHPLKVGTNSIYAILTHIMGADQFWIHQVIMGKEIRRDREAEFRASGSLDELLTRWNTHWAVINSILEELDHSQLLEVRPVPSRPQQKEPITVQWIILHLISHYATHLGHIQLTRQLWDQNKSNIKR
jgi:uncharacterized damage-inducible protein DinB